MVRTPKINPSAIETSGMPFTGNFRKEWPDGMPITAESIDRLHAGPLLPKPHRLALAVLKGEPLGRYRAQEAVLHADCYPTCVWNVKGVNHRKYNAGVKALFLRHVIP